MSTGTVALLVGDPGHAVNRHLTAVAAAAGLPVLDAARRGDTVHLDLTDRLLGPDLAAAEAGAAALLARLAGCRLVLGLHDVPGDGAWSTARRPLFRALAAAADRVVVASGAERTRLLALGVAAPVSVIPLPVPDAPRAPVSAVAASVTVVGYVWPGRGHDEVIDARDAVCRDLPVLCVGRAAPGHDDDAAALAARPGVRVTGWVDEAALAAVLAAPTVPVAPNRAVSASTTIAAWWSRGRRPLVPDTAYARELEAREPGALLVYDDLAPALAAACADPTTTYLPAGRRPGPDLATVAACRARL